MERKSEIKHFVATAKLEEAVRRCIDFYRDFNNQDDDAAILVSTTYYLILIEEKSGLITSEQALVRKQQIAARILNILKEIQIN
ncbi:MAG TPA: hypothetical protein VK168_20110 [Saprospiraceae bacterium]|nr:hypothetical protein [Saprospiraceae bacterium]